MTHVQRIEIAIFAYALLITFHFRGIDIFEKITISAYTRYVTRYIRSSLWKSWLQQN